MNKTTIHSVISLQAFFSEILMKTVDSSRISWTKRRKDKSTRCQSRKFTSTASSDNNIYLFRLGLNNFIGSGFISDDEASDSDSDSSGSEQRSYRRKRRVDFSPTDYKNKEDSAEDYFDINELADESADDDTKDDYDDIEKAIPAVKVSADSDKNGEATDDKDLMPPPPQNAAPSAKQEDSDASIDAKSKFQ